MCLIKLFFELQVLLELFDLFKTSIILHAPWKLVELCQKPHSASHQSHTHKHIGNRDQIEKYQSSTLMLSTIVTF